MSPGIKQLVWLHKRTCRCDGDNDYENELSIWLPCEGGCKHAWRAHRDEFTNRYSFLVGLEHTQCCAYPHEIVEGLCLGSEESTNEKVLSDVQIESGVSVIDSSVNERCLPDSCTLLQCDISPGRLVISASRIVNCIKGHTSIRSTRHRDLMYQCHACFESRYA